MIVSVSLEVIWPRSRRLRTSENRTTFDKNSMFPRGSTGCRKCDYTACTAPFFVIEVGMIAIDVGVSNDLIFMRITLQ